MKISELIKTMDKYNNGVIDNLDTYIFYAVLLIIGLILFYIFK